MTRYELESDDGRFVVDVFPEADGYRVVVSGEEYLLKLKSQPGQNITIESEDKPVAATILEATPHVVQLVIGEKHLSYRRATSAQGPPASDAAVVQAQRDLVVAPMPGKIISTLVKANDSVQSGDPLVVIESMKMEVAVRADRDGEVTEVLVSEGSAVKRGQGLVRLRVPS
jgi:biotin carboxyl carrier protein